MQNAIKYLSRHPDKHFYVNNGNEAEARELLTELNLLEKFQMEGPEVPAGPQVNIGECPSHYIVALLFTDDPDPGKNGFLIFAVPRRETPPARMRRILAGILNDFRITGFTVTETMFSPSEDSATDLGEAR